MKIKRLQQFALFLMGLALCASLAGCSRNSKESPDKLFLNSPPIVYQAWTHARNLDNANDWMNAAEAYDKVNHMDLTKPQAAAVDSAVMALYSRLKKNASDGDPSAKRLLDELNDNMRRLREAEQPQ